MEDLIAALTNVDNGKLIPLMGIIMWLDIRRTVKSMAESMATLSERVGIVVERVDSHEKRIDKLEDK